MLPQLVEGGSSEDDLADMCRLLDFLAVEMAANRNFEFVQALLRLTLQARNPRSLLWTFIAAYSTCLSHAHLLFCLERSALEGRLLHPHDHSSCRERLWCSESFRSPQKGQCMHGCESVMFP
jgi:hypothetical protein